MVSQTRETEMIFILKGIALCSRKLRIYGPKCGWLSKRWYKRGELRKNRAAERSKKGVVGKRGTKIPITPKTQKRIPKTTYTYLIIEDIWPIFLSGTKIRINQKWHKIKTVFFIKKYIKTENPSVTVCLSGGISNVWKKKTAAAYSPTGVQYHRRKRA